MLFTPFDSWGVDSGTGFVVGIQPTHKGPRLVTPRRITACAGRNSLIIYSWERGWWYFCLYEIDHLFDHLFLVQSNKSSYSSLFMQMIDPSVVGRLNFEEKAATSQLTPKWRDGNMRTTPDGLWFRYVSMGPMDHLVEWGFWNPSHWKYHSWEVMKWWLYYVV